MSTRRGSPQRPRTAERASRPHRPRLQKPGSRPSARLWDGSGRPRAPSEVAPGLTRLGLVERPAGGPHDAEQLPTLRIAAGIEPVELGSPETDAEYGRW